MNIYKAYNFFLPFFRHKRLNRFINTFSPGTESRILDVGGLPWVMWDLIEKDFNITLLNLTIPEDISRFPTNFTFVQGDGTKLPYPDYSFDIVYSNSVIEHLNSWENQLQFAREINRVSKNVWVQTPAKSFFIEPHLLTPFIHYLPKKWQQLLIRRLTIWGILTKPSPEQVKQFLAEIRLLSFAEMKTLFPDCIIIKEKFFFFTKSYIAIRRGH